MCCCVSKICKYFSIGIILFILMSVIFNCLVVRDKAAKKYFDDMLKSIEKMFEKAKNTVLPNND